MCLTTQVFHACMSLTKNNNNNFLIISTNTKIVVKGEDEGVEERKYGVVNERKTWKRFATLRRKCIGN